LLLEDACTASAAGTLGIVQLGVGRRAGDEMVLFRTILLLGLALALTSEAAAQSLTISGGSSATGRSGADFATTVIGDPWDFEQATDYVYMLSDDGTGSPAFTSIPTMANGMLSGVSRGQTPMVEMQFSGVDGAFNSIMKTGVRYPIDASRFRRLSFRMRRSNGLPDAGDLVGAFYWPNTSRGGGGLKLRPARGTSPGGVYANMSPAASQSGAGYQIYRIDLDATSPLQDGVAWSGIMRGLQLRLAQSSTAVGASFDLDWVRLTERGANTTRRLQWSGFGGRVVLTATHAQTGDVIQIYPDSGVDFADNSVYDWDYGYLPPGTWTVTATRGGTARSATLSLDAQPFINVLDPDISGGRDFATTVIGDAWDLTNQEDVTRHGRWWHMNSVSFGENGFTGVTRGGTYAQGCANDTCPDSFVQFMDDWSDAPGTALTIDANTYHRLTFTVEHDHKELMSQQVLDYAWGGVARVAWSRGNGAPYTVTQDIVVTDGGPQTFSVDLATLTDTSTLEAPIAALWQGAFPTFRIDTDEAERSRTVRVANVRLAADDAPNGNGFFPVRWSAFDANFSRQIATNGPGDATVTLYYDTDRDPAQKTMITSGVPATQGQYIWNVAGLGAGAYYVYAEITDGAGNTQGRYSTGPVRITSTITPQSDSNNNGLGDSFEAAYGVSNGLADEDGDGVANLEEYYRGTSPRLSNTWTLAEGATGFFAERLALANPDPAPADVTVTFLRPAPAAPITRQYSLLPYGRTTINVNEVAGLAVSDVSAVVTANTGGVVAERTMFWGDLWYGGHTGKAIQRTGTQWYLAEGAANDFFSTFVLLANPSGAPANVTLTFLLEPSGSVTRTYTVGANARLTIFTNDFTDNSGARALFGRSFSTRITSDQPIAVERAMYFSSNGRTWNGGHEASAVPAPQTTWFVAEGATGDFFSTFLLLANPNSSSVTTTIRYLLPGGNVVTANPTLPPQSRTTIPLNGVVPNTEVSASITASAPIIVERAMYWPASGWYEAHASAGVSQTGTQWALGEGEVGGARGFQSFVLIANPSGQAASVRLRFLREGGTSFTSAPFNVPANSRVTRSAGEFIGAGQLNGAERFGVLVESLNGVPIVVERAMYWNGGNQPWGGGTNETAVRMR
jgi:hypothetical protein